VKYLWAPWRLEYIKAPRTQGCVFCDFARDHRDREHRILARGTHAFAILNTFPYNSAHLMVVPFRHVANLGDLEDPELLDVSHLTTASIQAVTETYRPEGFNIGLNLGRAAGAGITDHLHMHVVPRWVGDTNYMPVLGEVKVLPEDLTQTYDRLAPMLQAILARRTAR
jgi:ATP adenylyltransferase